MALTFAPIRSALGRALLGVALVAGVSAGASEGPAVESTGVVAAVEAKYAAIEVIQASFTQTTRSALYGEETQTGDLVLKRPSKMRWNFTGDGKQFVTDGSTMWIYMPRDKQVLKYADFSSSMADALLQLDRIGDLFEVTEQAAEGAHVLELKPRGEAQFKHVLLTLDEAYVVQRVQITDPYDSVTDLVFADVQLGAAVSDDLFQFTVPEGAQVIEAGGG